jgi:L-lactate dehydrogenase (cytochrome)
MPSNTSLPTRLPRRNGGPHDEPDTRGLGLAPATAADYRELARRRLPRHLFDYIDGAAYDEVTAGENLRGFQRLTLRQRVLRDVSSLKLSTRVLGQDIALPVVLAPIGIAGAFARRAEVQAARAAEAAGIPFCESTVSICSIEEVGAATTAPFWYQLYVMRDRGFARELMQRAQAAGCPVLVLTVDLAVMGARYRDIRNGMAGGLSPSGRLCKAWDILSHPGWLFDVAIKGRPLTFGNLTRAVPDARSLPEFKAWVDSQFDPAVTWDDIAWVRENWPGKIVLKGVLDVEDARQAAERRRRRHRRLKPRRAPARRRRGRHRRPAAHRRCRRRPARPADGRRRAQRP